MSYESERDYVLQEATEAMIRMRQPVVRTKALEQRYPKSEDLIKELIGALEQLLKCHDAQSEQWAREAIRKAKGEA